MISEAVINLGVVGISCMLLIFYLIKFVFRYKHQYESNPLCTSAVIFCLLVVLLITCALPVDIFLVSYVKNPDGSFKDWATQDVLQAIDHYMFLTYYILYGLLITLIFLVIPFMHVFNNDAISSSRGRLHSALKYTFIFLLLMLALLFGGAYIRSQNIGPNDIFEKIVPIKSESKFQSAIEFVLALITTLGFFNVSFYTASGIFSWPLGLFQGTSSLSLRHESVIDRTELLRIRIATLQEKFRLGTLTDTERLQLDKAEDELLQLDREESVISEHRTSLSFRLRKAIRPIQIVSGIVFLMISLLILVTMILANVDRLTHSGGPKQGYILTKPTLFNPIEWAFTRAQNLFVIGPLPVLIADCFLVVATISGIRNLGLWFALTRLYRIKLARTTPQALLYFCTTIMLTVSSYNLLLYSMSPQYITFGNQYYRSPAVPNIPSGTNTTILAEELIPKQCTIADYDNKCLLTRTSVLIMRMMSHLWLIGAVFYWIGWIFIVISGMSLVAYLYRGKRQAVHDRMSEQDEFED